jgi:CubicO group peptidase (beta-lactamase class C family)
MKIDVLRFGKPEDVGIDSSRLSRIESIAAESISKKDSSSAVVFISRKGQLVYRRAFGNRIPNQPRYPAKLDTIYDLTSMTKVIATAPAITYLVEQGQVRLDDRVADIIPAFGTGALKKKVTVEHLLRHCSGLPGYGDYRKKDRIRNATKKIIADICKSKLVFEPGTQFKYSDIGYILLGEIVHLVSGQRIDKYTHDKIFQPLGMNDTLYNPPKRLWSRCSTGATRDGKQILGFSEVAQVMEGVAGNTGLFSTAMDISIFAQMLLDQGVYNGKRIFSPEIIEIMSKPSSLLPTVMRGFGWDLGIPNSSLRADIFPIGGFGQVGWTGPSVWMDPDSGTSVVIMANRLHPGKDIPKTHDFLLLRMKAYITNIVAGAIRD